MTLQIGHKSFCRYLSREADPHNDLRRLYRDGYESLKQSVMKSDDDADLKAPIVVCEVYGPDTKAVLESIKAVTVSAG